MSRLNNFELVVDKAYLLSRGLFLLLLCLEERALPQNLNILFLYEELSLSLYKKDIGSLLSSNDVGIDASRIHSDLHGIASTEVIA